MANCSLILVSPDEIGQGAISWSAWGEAPTGAPLRLAVLMVARRE
jgi:hypothetical protein